MRISIRLFRPLIFVGLGLLPALPAPAAGDPPARRLAELRERLEKTSQVLAGAGGYPAKAGRIDLKVREFVDLSVHPEHAGESRERLDAFLNEMRDLGVGVVGHGISIPAFVTPDGGIRQDLLREQVEEIERLSAKGFKVDRQSRKQ